MDRVDVVLNMLPRYFGESELAKRGKATPVGNDILSLSDAELRQLFARTEKHYSSITMFDFLLKFAPERIPALVDDLLNAEMSSVDYFCRRLLEAEPALYLPSVDRLFQSMRPGLFREKTSPHTRFTIGTYLAKLDFDRYGRVVLEIGRKCMATDGFAAIWMIDNFGPEVIDDIAGYTKTARLTVPIEETHLRNIVTRCVSVCGKAAIPVVLPLLKSDVVDLQIDAIGHFAALGGDTYRAELCRCIESGLKNSDPGLVVRFISSAARWDVKAVEVSLWPLVEHKSKPIREAAARALGRLGDEVLPKAQGYLSNRKSDLRVCAVHLLTAAGTEPALALLEQHLDREEDDSVREAILSSLQSAWAAQGKTISREIIEERILKNASKLRWPPAGWLDRLSLPTLRYSTGEAVPEQVVKYLIARQAKNIEISPSLELKPLYGVIDRASSTGLALDILHDYLASGAQAKDRWALACAGLLGDDRVVPVLVSRINEWGESSRGKLAEYAVQALALLGTDRALLAVDSMAMRYRTKMKNIGAAAAEAFIAAADALGVTPEELGDRVVPWLGFEPGKPRVIDCAGRQIEVRVGLDWKLKYLDIEKNKAVSSLPSTAQASVKEEFKELASLLREASKAQVMRIETLMVRQYRWPMDRWRELFAGHPVMAPFGVRLVWGAYGRSGELEQPFRVLDDGTFTDSADCEVTLDDQYTVGVIHPLDLDEESRVAWSNHLADYEIVPPFPQMERPVVTVTPDQTDVKFCKDFNGSQINGMTFKGRAERLGWRRGSVCDAGGITAYLKRFAGAGVDAFLTMNGMFVGMDMYSEIEIWDAFFVQYGSVEIGSYIYDEPNGEDDPRLIPFGQIPPIVFSEVMGDLQKITKGRQTEAEDE